MPVYAYKALDTQGRKTKGQVTAADKADALERLSRKGLAPLAVTTDAQDKPWWNRDIRFGSQKPMPHKDIVAFCDNLSAMLNASLPLTKALAFATSTAASKNTQQDLQSVSDKVADGQPLSDALDQMEQRFPEQLLAMIRIGEASNSLPLSAQRINELLRSQEKTRQDMQQAMIYPLILMAMSVLVIGILVFYLAPTLAPIFSGADAAPPTPIRVMMSLRAVFITNWPIILALAIGVTAVGLGFRSKAKLVFQSTARKMPILGTYIRKKATLDFCLTLHLMLANGGQLIDGLEAFENTTKRIDWRTATKDALQRIKSGSTLRSTLLTMPIVDQTAVAVLTAGEESDGLKDVLPPLISTLERQTQQSLGLVLKLITPVLTLLLGILVGAIIISTINAILDLNDVII